MSEVQFIVFTVNGEVFCVDAMSVRKLIKYQDIYKADNMPWYIDGIARINNEKIPIIDLGLKFDTGRLNKSKTTKIIVSGTEESSIGFLVDDVTEFIKVDSDNIEETPDILKRIGNSYVKAVAKKDDEFLIIMELNDVLSRQEKEEIKEFVSNLATN
jgi:purine-binding chemotaxis protein CheW